MKGVLIDCRPACHSWMTMWLTGDLLDVDLLQERLDAIAPVGCGIRLVDVPPGVLLFQVAQGQVLAIEVVPLDIMSPDFNLTTAAAGPLGARPVDGPNVSVQPDDHPVFGTSSPAAVAVAHAEPELGGPGSALVGVHPDLYFAATFFVFTPAYQPEGVEVRLLPGSTVPDALAIVAAARLPMPRLRFPRLLSVRYQTLYGAAVAIAVPPWPTVNVCVFFDCALTTGRAFCLDVAPSLRLSQILQLCDVPADAAVLVFIGDMPWPLAPDTAVGVREGDTIQVLPVDHDPLAVTELQHTLQDPGCWRVDVRVLSDHGPVMFSAEQGWAASSRRDLARRLQVPEGLRLCRADLLEQDYSYRGDTVVAVYVVRPAPDEHAHAVSQPVICFLDLRPLLLDISWMCLEQPWLDCNSLVARFAPRCPPGYEIGCSTGMLDPAPRYQGLPIIDGQVVVIDFVPQDSNTNGWPVPHPPASGSSDPGDSHSIRSVRPGGMRAPPAGGAPPLCLPPPRTARPCLSL